MALEQVANGRWFGHGRHPCHQSRTLFKQVLLWVYGTLTYTIGETEVNVCAAAHFFTIGTVEIVIASPTKISVLGFACNSEVAYIRLFPI